jgi:hypothetical protein
MCQRAAILTCERIQGLVSLFEVLKKVYESGDLPNMSIINCSVPSSTSMGDSGPAHSPSRNIESKVFKLRGLESEGPDEVATCVNSSNVEASNKVSGLGRSPRISAMVIWGGLLKNRVLRQSVMKTLAANLHVYVRSIL